MQQPLPLPLPEPPADLVAQVLDELRYARRELTDAERLGRLLSIDVDQLDGNDRARVDIERATADYRRSLWAARVAAAAARARSLGLDVSSTL